MLIKFGKEMIEIGDVTVDTTIDELQERVEFVTGCINVKLIMKGKFLNSNLTQALGTIPGGIMAKISAIGSKQSEIDSSQQSDRIARRIINDLNGPPQYSQERKESSRVMEKQSPYSFGGIQTLPGLKDEYIARNILEELSRDVGVLAVMEKHRYKVGALCELYPEGYVGVSDVCILGLNEGKGIRILLRLRTDDLKGFRKILSIRKVLFHELAHNVHSEHDSNFYKLMRQIEREVVELDWRAGKAKTVGGTSAYSSQFSSTSTSTKVTATGSSSQICSANVHRLGGEGERGSGSGSRGGSESALESGMRTRSNLITSTQDTFSSSTAGNAAISRMIQLQPARGLDVHHSQRYLLPQNNSNSNNDSNNDNDDARQQLQLEVTTDAASGVAASGVLRERGSQHSTTDFQSNLKMPNSTYDFTHTEVATTDTEKDDYKEVEKERRISNIPVSVSVPNLSENIIFISDPICLDEESSDLRVHAEALMDDDKEKSDMMDVVIENENQEENENEIRMMKIVEMETENVHFEYISRKVLQQLDDVMSTAAQFDSSAPIERMNMMRDGLVLLLQRDQIESYEEGKMTGSRTREKSSEMDLINSQERMGYDGRVPSTTASTDKKVGDVTNIKRVSDINDTMQLLMTIIANAKNYPTEAKFKKVKKSTKIFTRLVGSRAGADRILVAAGFEEKEDCFSLNRDDPGLLYLVHSMLEQSIAVMVN